MTCSRAWSKVGIVNSTVFYLTESILTNSIVQIIELLSFHEGLLIKQFASKVKVIFSYSVVAIFLLRITLQAIVDRRRLLPNLNLKRQ